MGKKLFVAFFLAASIAASATHCPVSEAIIGKGIGKNDTEADNAADIQIANNIKSSLSIESSDYFSQREVDRILTDSTNFSQTATGKSFLENREAVKPLKARYKDEDGNIVSERYMCKSDAAKPYLGSLSHFTNALRNHARKITKESCESINETYNNIKRTERVLSNLGVDFSKEHSIIYKEAQAECSKDVKGIFLDENYNSDEELVRYVRGLANFQAEGSRCGKGGILVRIALKEIGEDGCIIDKIDKDPRYECKIDIKISGEDCYTRTMLPVINAVVTGKDNNPNEAKRKAEKNLRSLKADECSPRCKNGSLRKQVEHTLGKWEKGEK